MASPSVAHEAPLHLLRASPALVVTLLRDVLGLSVAEPTEVRVEEGDLTQLVPTELRADLVLTVRDASRTVGVIVERQLAPNPRKRFVWPLYAAALHAKLEVPVALVVLAATEEVARWASRPIETVQMGSSFVPHVVGPSQIPRVTSVEQAIASPERAVLSALTHGRSPEGGAIAFAAIEASRRLDEERAKIYVDLVLSSLGDVARAILEAMTMQKYEYQSEFARKYYGEGREEGQLSKNARSGFRQACQPRLRQVDVVVGRDGPLPRIPTTRERDARARATTAPPVAEGVPQDRVQRG